MIPGVSLDAYEAARRRAAFIDRSGRGRIIVSGADRRSYLQGLLTNDIAALAAGRGCYAAWLTAQGRMISDLHVYELGDAILVTVEGDTKETVLTTLNQFVFAEDVQVSDATSVLAQIAVVGPEAARMVSRVLTGTTAETLAALPEHGNLRSGPESIIVTRVDDTGEPGFEMFVDHATVESFASALEKAGAAPLDASTADAIRIEAGVPLFHRDMNEETIPLEAGIESRAISFTKGCYVGQEVVIRVLHRGHGRVVRKLVGLLLGGTGPAAAGTIVRAAERDVGHVTSSTFSPALQKPIALAYVHRDFVAAGTAVAVDGVRAEVTALPFVRSE